MYNEIKKLVLEELKTDKTFRQLFIKILFEDEEIKEYIKVKIKC